MASTGTSVMDKVEPVDAPIKEGRSELDRVREELDVVREEYVRFREKVAEVAKAAAERHDWCEVVQRVVEDELGLDWPEEGPVTFEATFTIRFEATPNRPNPSEEFIRDSVTRRGVENDDVYNGEAVYLGLDGDWSDVTVLSTRLGDVSFT